MKLCKKCNKIDVRKDQEICFDCFKKWKNMRHIARNEIVLDCDNTDGYGRDAILQVGLMMSVKGYRMEVWDHGGKSYHLHIKDIPYIDKLEKDQNKKYKELVTKKYIEEAKHYTGDQIYFEDFDLSVCIPDHLIAEENKPHHRSKKVKKLITIVNEELTNKCEKDIFEIVSSEEKEYKSKVKGSGITAKIIEKISIVEVARNFGLEVDNQHFAICPFHNDSAPSLKFYDEQGRFCCFGCNTKGNIIVFYALMKKLNLYKCKEVKL